MAISEVAAEPRPSQLEEGEGVASTEGERPRRRLYAGAGVTAGAAVVAGVLLLTREQSLATLSVLAIAVGALALFVAAAAAREWRFARSWTGPDGVLEPLAGPMTWLAMVFAAVVVATNFVPVIVPAWTSDQVFAVAIVAFVILSVLGWGPGVSVAWPSGLRLSSLTLVGTLVALGLVGTYLIFLALMRGDATTANDLEWARLVEIRATLEALAFAAAGALLGTVVQRQAVSGELRAQEDAIRVAESSLEDTRAVLAERELEVESLRSSVSAAVRLLTPEAPDDLDSLQPEQLSAFATRPTSTAVRQARRALLESLRTQARV